MRVRVLTMCVLIAMITAMRARGAERIVLSTPTGDIEGTLELPKQKGPYPVALIIAGSGPTDRDGNAASVGLRNDHLKMLAEALAAQGIASVRYDKRGVAASSATIQNEADLRFSTFVDDVVAWGRKLQQDKRFSELIVIGHSEGSMVGMMATTKLKPRAFVSISGPARTAPELLRQQLPKNLPPNLVEPALRITAELEAGRKVDDVPVQLRPLFRPSVQPYALSWFPLDPKKEIVAVECPILILQGTTDIQVPAVDAQTLGSKNPRATVVVIDGMNHIMKMVPPDMTQQRKSYNDPTLPVSPVLVDKLATFIKAPTVPATPQ